MNASTLKLYHKKITVSKFFRKCTKLVFISFSINVALLIRVALSNCNASFSVGTLNFDLPTPSSKGNVYNNVWNYFKYLIQDILSFEAKIIEAFLFRTAFCLRGINPSVGIK